LQTKKEEKSIKEVEVSRYIGPLCRLCRAEGAKLYLKGKRCTTKCPMDNKKSYPPGMRGARINYKKSHYKKQLREKQKVKRFYGVGERQFRKIFYEAASKKGITGDNLLKTLEMRFDNIVYKMNFAYSRAHARQLIRHGHLLINGKKVTIPSYILNVNDEVSFKESSLKNENIKSVLEDAKGLVDVPAWLVVDKDNFKGKVNKYPTREDVSLEGIEEHLIVELYSK